MINLGLYSLLDERRGLRSPNEYIVRSRPGELGMSHLAGERNFKKMLPEVREVLLPVRAFQALSVYRKVFLSLPHTSAPSFSKTPISDRD